MNQIKIYRFNNRPSYFDDCWQKSIVNSCTMPCFNDDLAYVLRETPKHERKYWIFGFTKAQFVKACRTFKHQAKFCIDKTILHWSDESTLETYLINRKHIWIFDDQVLFDKRQIKRNQT